MVNIYKYITNNRGICIVVAVPVVEADYETIVGIRNLFFTPSVPNFFCPFGLPFI